MSTIRGKLSFKGSRMRKYEQACPIARTLDIIGDRWTLLILRDLFMGSTKFVEIRTSCSGIPPKVLSARLKMLIDEGLIQRSVYSEHPLRAEYLLTERGRSLLPVMLAIGRWGLMHMFEDETKLRDAVARAIYEQWPEAREELSEIVGGKGRTRTD
jgi:DNA-binding HxlR family transcriptional regulator